MQQMEYYYRGSVKKIVALIFLKPRSQLLNSACCLFFKCSPVLTKAQILFSQAQNPNEPNFKIPFL